MDQREDSPIRYTLSLSLLICPWGCAPTVDVAGVYFPGWLVSAITGVAISYAIVVWLARRPGSKNPAGSGLLFSSLSVGLALAIWWVCFRGF
jgi:hypothetical protein